ncbi:MAG: helix-turn-helix domain-containing protein [Gemmataceae bacterium]
MLALRRARGNRSHAADLLGLTRARLQRRLEQLRLTDSEADT